MKWKKVKKKCLWCGDGIGIERVNNETRCLPSVECTNIHLGPTFSPIDARVSHQVEAESEASEVFTNYDEANEMKSFEIRNCDVSNVAVACLPTCCVITDLLLCYCALAFLSNSSRSGFVFMRLSIKLLHPSMLIEKALRMFLRLYFNVVHRQFHTRLKLLQVRSTFVSLQVK